MLAQWVSEAYNEWKQGRYTHQRRAAFAVGACGLRRDAASDADLAVSGLDEKDTISVPTEAFKDLKYVQNVFGDAGGFKYSNPLGADAASDSSWSGSATSSSSS